MEIRLIQNPTGTFNVTPKDAGQLFIVKSTKTGVVAFAKTDDIIKAHEHTNTWQVKRHWHGANTAREFQAI